MMPLKAILKKCLVAGVLCLALPSSAQVSEFEVVSRKPLPGGTSNFMGLTKNNASAYYRPAMENGKAVYKVTAGTGTATINALSYVAYAKGADRIVTYGDSIEKHVVTNAYVRIYSGSGALIKSLGPVAHWPFIATLAENGDFIVAGNRDRAGGNPKMFIVCFDKNGNKLWEKNLPKMTPQKIVSAPDRKYIGLVLQDEKNLRTNLMVFDKQSSTIRNSPVPGVSALEFLPSDKMVVASGSEWSIYNMKGGFTPLASGTLQGNTIGQFPITAHPRKDMFFIVSLSNSGGTGYRIQAISSRNGSVLAESVFATQPYWQPYRLAELVADDRINLTTTAEMIELRIRQ